MTLGDVPPGADSPRRCFGALDLRQAVCVSQKIAAGTPFDFSYHRADHLLRSHQAIHSGKRPTGGSGVVARDYQDLIRTGYDTGANDPFV